VRLTIEDLLDLLLMSGARQYGGERVSQLEHALQAASLAEGEGADETLVVAALLHDLGHLLAKKAEGRDDHHELIGAKLLEALYPRAVTEPIRLHVDAKRYLCAMEAGYFDRLSPASVHSLDLQGGVFSTGQAGLFSGQQFATDAIRLRRWDDLAKDPDAATRKLVDYEPLLRRLAS
jgi:phosphonate degradation associated HDIG domain protein